MRFKKLLFFTILLSFASLFSANAFAQSDSTDQNLVITESASPSNNSVFTGFKPFSTPRTNGRPGTVFRTDYYSNDYYVEDVKQIISYSSSEGNIIGRMSFTPPQLLQILNIEISADEPVWVEVELENVEREYNEQTQVDDVLWEKDKIETLVVDEFSKYYLIRETVSTKKISFRFNQDDYEKILTGAGQLTKLKAKKGILPDFPYEIIKSWKEPRRIFYKEQEIGLEAYPEIEEE